MADLPMESSMSQELDILYKLPAARLRQLKKSPERSAAVIDLRYVNDGMKGIERIKHGERFRYRLKNVPLTDKDLLARIKKLAIPPAWTDVWICPYDNGHLQATGKDAKGRKQYRYHAKWSTVRSRTKFHHALEFANRLPQIRKRLQRDLSTNGLTRERVLALVVSILDHTQIRVGNQAYEKQNNSYGLSTMKDKHVKEVDGSVRLVFKGKTGIAHNIKIHSKKLGQLVQQCRDLPGQELFQYVNDQGEPTPIDSGMVNDYIRGISEGPFTSKDFRTWKGTVHCMKAMITATCPETASARKDALNKALDEAALALGNTRSVCRKYYVHPEVISAYEREKLDRIVRNVERDTDARKNGYTFEERLVLKVLAAARRTK